MGIMNELPPVTVDVRDMLCAQALALVAQAVARGTAAGEFVVRYNAEDVQRDLLVWAQERGYPARVDGTGALRILRP